MSNPIVGAAIVSHHPGLFQDKDFRLSEGKGRDSDLIEGFNRIRKKIDEAKPDTLVIFDSHWFTTGEHCVDACAEFKGTYISHEMPWYLYGQKFDYTGDPELAFLCEDIAKEKGVIARAIPDATMERQYATINIVNALRKDEKIMSVGSCQTAGTQDFLDMGEVIGEAIRRSGRRCVLLASGALSHKFKNINVKYSNPRVYHPDNVSSDFNRESDYKAIEFFKEGRHDIILDRFDEEYARTPWEALGAHYLQMIAAMGGSECRAKGIQLSEYENAHGTGNLHMWFEV